MAPAAARALMARLERRALLTLWIAAALSALGRSWTHFTGERPYWSLFWSEELLAPPLGLLGVSWDSFVESERVEAALGALTTLLAFAFTFAALRVTLAALEVARGDGPPRLTRALRAALWGLVGLQALYVGTHWLGHSLHMPIWLEYATHIALPWLCLRAGCSPLEARGRRLARAPITVTRLAITCTFVGHALYALGVYPVPSDFVVMIMSTLSCSEGDARVLLSAAGALDLLAAAWAWTPRALIRLRWGALWYMTLWGLLTALARVWGHWDTASPAEVVWQWLPEVLLRLPHAIVPLWLLTLEGGLTPPWRRARSSHGDPQGAPRGEPTQEPAP